MLCSIDPCANALTGGNMTLLPDFGRVMIRSLALAPGVSHMFTARDDTGALVGFTIFALPGQLMFSTYVVLLSSSPIMIFMLQP